MHKLSMGVVASKGDGTKLSNTIKVPEMVRAKVFEALCGLRSKNFEGHYLPIDLTSLGATVQQPNQHCVAEPDLLPDTILVPKLILQKTVSHTREILNDSGSLQSMYEKLLAVAQEEPSLYKTSRIEN
nr:unnamed protein product [Digitaria exilis]